MNHIRLNKEILKLFGILFAVFPVNTIGTDTQQSTSSRMTCHLDFKEGGD